MNCLKESPDLKLSIYIFMSWQIQQVHNTLDCRVFFKYKVIYRFKLTGLRIIMNITSEGHL